MKSESSAYNNCLYDTADAISFKYNMNNRGPRIEPCDTAQAMYFASDIVPPISVTCVLTVKWNLKVI